MAAMVPGWPLALLPDWLTAASIWILFLMLAGFFIFLFVALWVREDAERHGMSGILWGILLVAAGTLLVIVGGIVVLVVYFLVRIEHPGTARHPAIAGAPAPPPPPPAPAGPPVTSCKTCGAPVSLGAAFCPNCGSKV